MKTMRRMSFALLATAFAVPAGAEDFNLDALIKAAQAEPGINVVDSTGKIVDMAEGFAKKYGVKATGTKSKATAQLESVVREAQSGNVQGDVALISDVPAAMGQLLPEGFAISWVPPDLAADIDPKAQNPLLVVSSPNILTFNTTLSKDCPVKNIWDLTEPEWKGKLAMQDPLGKPSYTDWFNQMRSHADNKVAAAYQAKYGKALETDLGSATEAFVTALAANGPLLTDSDSAAADAVAAHGQTETFVGLVSAAKFRDNADGKLTLGLCTGVDPIIGFTNATVGLIVKGTNSPNAAKLFIHYAMTGEGIAPQAEDGKISYNRTVKLPADEPSGIEAHIAEVLPYDPSTGLEDWDSRQDWQDIWRLSYKK